jgi:hypothetical protein
VEIMAEYAQRREIAPDIAIRSHKHKHFDTCRLPGVRVLALPAWQLGTDWVKQAIPESLRADESMKGLVIGIEATQRELEKVFASHGITRIASMGLPLDPNQHQAMLEVPSNDHEPGTVVQEMQAGWMIKDRLLRAAMVAVAKKPD